MLGALAWVVDGFSIRFPDHDSGALPKTGGARQTSQATQDQCS